MVKRPGCRQPLFGHESCKVQSWDCCFRQASSTVMKNRYFFKKQQKTAVSFAPFPHMPFSVRRCPRPPAPRPLRGPLPTRLLYKAGHPPPPSLWPSLSFLRGGGGSSLPVFFVDIFGRCFRDRVRRFHFVMPLHRGFKSRLPGAPRPP